MTSLVPCMRLDLRHGNNHWPAHDLKALLLLPLLEPPNCYLESELNAGSSQNYILLPIPTVMHPKPMKGWISNMFRGVSPPPPTPPPVASISQLRAQSSSTYHMGI